MPLYIEYELEDGASVLIEAPDDIDGEIVKVSRGVGEIVSLKAKKSFEAAIKDTTKQAKLLLKEIEELHVNEAEIKFGLNTVGELGNMAIGKLGIGVNYEITLKWQKPDKES